MKKVIAPGKIILSGEHAVLYGHPVLAMAVNYYMQAQIAFHEKQTILFDLENLNIQNEITFPQIQNNFLQIQKRYQQYQQNELTIREVLQHPSELIQYVLGLFSLKNIQFKLQLSSSIPVGCGMGSSAAVILSSLYAVVNFFDLTFSKEQLFALALDAENKQHGKSSGIDLRVSLQGGVLYRENNQYFSANKIDFPMYLVNTGTPETTTGECVAHTKKFFETSSIGEDFAAVTKALATVFSVCHSRVGGNPLLLSRESANNKMDSHLRGNDNEKDILPLIRQNHRLLVKIGAVPEKIQQFIQQVEQMDGAAKICGAGAVRGDNGGVVLIVCENQSALKKICQAFGYTLLPLKCEPRGLYVI